MKTPEKLRTATIGRPRLSPGKHRVLLSMQRVSPITLARIKTLSPIHGGISRVIDAAVARLWSAFHHSNSKTKSKK